MSKSFKLKNGSLLISTESSGGIYNSQQLHKLAELCEREDVVIKATEDQRLALFIPEDKLGTTEQELSSLGLGVRHYQQGLHQPVNCIGALCPFYEQDAMQASLKISEELAGIELANPLKIGINGCGRSCVPTHTLDISIVGDAGGYRLHLGGKNSQIPELAMFMAEGIPADELPALVRKVVEIYREQAQEDETLHDLIERQGSSQFVEALQPYSQDAHTGLEAEILGTEPEQAGTVDFSGSKQLPDEDDELQLLSPEDVEKAVGDFSPISEAPSSLEADVDIDPSDFQANEQFDSEVAEVRVSADSEESPASEMIADDMVAADSFEPASALSSELSSDLESGGFTMVEGSPADSASASQMDESQMDEDLLDTIGENQASTSIEHELLGHEPELIEYDLDDDLATKTEPASGLSESSSLTEDPGEPQAGNLETEALLEEDFEELSDDAADAFEERLESSIAQEEEISSQIDQYDQDQEERLETVSLVEAAAFDESMELEDQIDDDVFDDDSIASELMEQSLALSESAAFSQHFADNNEHSLQNEPAHFTFDVDAQGRGVLVFENGLQLVFDPSRFAIGAVKHMNLHGARLRLSCLPQGLEIDVDGITMLVPYDSSQSA